MPVHRPCGVARTLVLCSTSVLFIKSSFPTSTGRLNAKMPLVNWARCPHTRTRPISEGRKGSCRRKKRNESGARTSRDEGIFAPRPRKPPVASCATIKWPLYSRIGCSLLGHGVVVSYRIVSRRVVPLNRTGSSGFGAARMPAASNPATTRTRHPKRSRRDGDGNGDGDVSNDDDDDALEEDNDSNGSGDDTDSDAARDSKQGGTTAGNQPKKKRKAGGLLLSPPSARTRDGYGGNDGGGGFTTDPSKLAMMSRSERKRHREKKRRSDVNRGFEDLIGLLVEVDSGVRLEVEEERARRLQARAGAGPGAGSGSGDASSTGKSKTRRAETAASAATSASTGDDNILSRVDMIDRATTVLRRLHAENEQRKVLIEHLMAQQQGRLQNADPSTAASRSRSSAPLFLFDQPSWVRPTLLFVR
jgi:hypothetical protein